MTDSAQMALKGLSLNIQGEDKKPKLKRDTVRPEDQRQARRRDGGIEQR